MRRVFNILLVSHILISLIFGISSHELNSLYPERHIYTLCGDRYTQGNNIVISNAANIIVDCRGKVIGHGGSVDPSNAPSGILINNSENITIANCNFQKLDENACLDCNDLGLPGYIPHPHAFNALIIGLSDNIEFIDCNFTYDVKINNSGNNKFDGVRFDAPNRKLSFYGDGKSLIKDSSINLLRILTHKGNIEFDNSDMNIEDFILLEQSTNTTFKDSTLHSGDIKIVSNNNNNLIINNLRNETNINNEIISNTSFGIRFDNLTLAHPENNSFVLEVDDGFAKVNQSELKMIDQRRYSKVFSKQSKFEILELHNSSQLLSQGSRVNEFHLKNGNNIKYIGPMQWYDNITADSDIAQFMVGRLHFIYIPSGEHAVRCGLAVITDSSGHEHKCVMTPDNYGWLYVDESYTGLLSGDVLLNYTYKVKTLGDGIHKQDGSGIYMTTDECRHDLESFGAINSYTPNCTVLTPDIHGDIGNITDPCPFQTKPDGYYYYKCYHQINDWAKNWSFDGSGGWFSEYGLPVPSHYLEES